MQFALTLRELLKRWPLLAVGVPIAVIAAVFSVYRVEGHELKARSLQYSGASTQVLVDAPSSVLGNLSQSFEPLSSRATVYANFMASPAVLKLIGQQARLSGEQIYAAGPVSAQQPRVVQEPTALKRNVEITGETNPYRLNFESQTNLPTINIFAQAPTTRQAVLLANGAVIGLQRYVTSLEDADKVPAHSRVTIRQLGTANGAVVDGGISKALAALTFVAVFLLWCVLILVAARFGQYWRASAVREDVSEESAEGTMHTEGGVGVADAPLSRSGAFAPDIPPLDGSLGHSEDRAAVPTRSVL